MSRSAKARHGTKCKFWKDTVHAGKSAAKARTSWKRLGARSERRAVAAPKVNRRTGKRSVGGLDNRSNRGYSPDSSIGDPDEAGKSDI